MKKIYLWLWFHLIIIVGWDIQNIVRVGVWVTRFKLGKNWLADYDSGNDSCDDEVDHADDVDDEDIDGDVDLDVETDRQRLSTDQDPLSERLVVGRLFTCKENWCQQSEQYQCRL